MAELKLGKLPDRTPVKLAITVTPDLHQMLQNTQRDTRRHMAARRP